MGDRAIHTGASESSDRVLSDSFSEDWPPLRIYDLGQPPNGTLRAVGSQLIYNRESRESLFFGALSADRFLTIMHLKVNPEAPISDDIISYTVDSTGTTEIQASDPESGLNLNPDAFTVSRQMIEERRMQAPLTLSEAQASITLAAVSGGMFEIGDDLPTLGSAPERLSLLTNPDLLQMVKLGRTALPLDLLTYSSEDGQPAVFLLHEDQRQAMLVVFNWTEKPRSHVFTLPELALSPHHSYLLTDVFHREDHLSVNGGAIKIDRLAAHSVRLIKIIDESIPAAPSISVTAPQGWAVGEDLRFAGIVTNQSVPALVYHWDFGDGVVTDGATATHTYTHAGTFKAHLTVEGVDGVFYQHIFPVAITGNAALSPPRRYVVENP